MQVAYLFQGASGLYIGWSATERRGHSLAVIKPRGKYSSGNPSYIQPPEPPPSKQANHLSRHRRCREPRVFQVLIEHFALEFLEL